MQNYLSWAVVTPINEMASNGFSLVGSYIYSIYMFVLNLASTNASAILAILALVLTGSLVVWFFLKRIKQKWKAHKSIA